MSREATIQEIVDNMTKVKRSMQGYFQDVFDKIGISPAQLEILKTIRGSEPISHKALAGQSNLTPGAVTQLLDGLDDADCIVRTPSPSDRRISYISISPTGKQLLQRLQKSRRQMFDKMFADMDDHELALYLQVQQKLLVWITDNHVATSKIKEKNL